MGPALLIAVAMANVVVWVVARPAAQPTGRFLGELFGAEAVLLLALTLVLATVLTPIERAFGGLDRVAQWHRRTAVAAVVLLVPHVALVTSPPDPYATNLGHALGEVALAGLILLSLWALAPSLRTVRWPGFVRWLGCISYERWLSAHRLAGIFVGAALVHGTLVDPILRNSSTLRTVYIVVGAGGLVAYLYRELLARFVIPQHDYVVNAVRQLDDDTVDIALEPVKNPVTFIAGQFVFLAFGGPAGWRRHPFTIASSPSARQLRVSVKGVGDDTRKFPDELRPGTPAKVTGAFGGFDYTKGGPDQVWIAGGIGITPFLSWLRDLNDTFDRHVDLYYSVAHSRQELFIDEIESIAAAHASLTLHVITSDNDGQLNARTVMNDRNTPPWVYMCGPPAMMTALSQGFREAGVPSAHVRWERFDVR